MSKKSIVFLCFFLVINLTPLFTQTHNAVPLGDSVYHIIETLQMRGLVGFLPNVKPYSKAQILKIIENVLNHNNENALTQAERAILEQHKTRLNPARDGLNYVRGTISGEIITEEGIYFSYEFGLGLETIFSSGFYPIAGGYKDVYTFENEAGDDIDIISNHLSANDFAYAFEIAPAISFTGDLGRNNSYGLEIIGRIVRNPRVTLGRGHNANDDFNDGTRQIRIFSEPVAYFPYTYKKRWDGFVFPTDNISSSGMVAWPYNVSIGYTMFPEFSGTALKGHVNYRIARYDREWAGITSNSSLVLNQTAQPFLAGEITITPFSWFSISSLTGVLEFANAIGLGADGNDRSIKESSAVFQNAFSIVMLELNYKNYFNFTLGSSSLWPKRFELGYPFPFAENFLYQNNIGDYDNMALFVNILGQSPRFGKLWFSIFLDEINISEKDLFSKDRSMFAFQTGTKVLFPWLPFSSITLSYTKVEPYNYTHTREKTPWYGDLLMESNYVNAGKPLGHYIPPNSDELLLRFETTPLANSLFSFQYQMIRHGADYGDRAVDGSSLFSELARGKKRSQLNKYFLRDGAYQWMHIFKVRGEYSLAQHKVPVKCFLEAGFVYSYFTDIFEDDGSEAPVNSESMPYRIINRPDYPKQLGIIGTIGVMIFPKL